MPKARDALLRAAIGAEYNCRPQPNAAKDFPSLLLRPITGIAAFLTTIAMAGLGLGVDVRAVARTGVRVTLAVTASLIVFSLMSYALIRAAGIG